MSSMWLIPVAFLTSMLTAVLAVGGTAVRQWLPEGRFRWLPKVLLTLLADRLLLSQGL